MTNLKLIQQGAEAKIFLDEKSNLVIKDRISKSYRIPEIDKTIRKRRTKSETKLLEKASKIINIPAVIKIMGDESNFAGNPPEYSIKMEYIDGKKLSQHLDKFDLKEQKEIMKIIGNNIALLHKNDIIHGDLTTSNMILVEDLSESKNLKIQKKVITSPRESRDAERAEIEASSGGRAGISFSIKKVYFIDFGLGYISKKIEDKAVDLHLLKQALEAKHFTYWKELFETVSKSYEKTIGREEAKKVFERITAVEKRGRYRH